MKRIAVIYASVHHGNTKKLLEGMAAEIPMDLFSVEEAKDKDLSSYGVVGIASGLYFGKMHKSLLAYLDSKPSLPEKAFAVISCGDGGAKHIEDAKETLRQYNLAPLGAFVCKGFDTYGPFKLIGGINKNHPDAADVKKGIEFLKSEMNEAVK